MHDKDDLDLLIDGALETYANPAPNDYLEDRMLQAVRIQIANQPAPSDLLQSTAINHSGRQCERSNHRRHSSSTNSR